METIKIPSPSAILDPPDLGPIINQSVGAAKQQARLSPPKQTAASSAKLQNTLNRPKQSKSRNGCTTCKTKRLKCDETKPTCHQCLKRNVTCGGYKKDFKWRPFEETTIGSKSTAKVKRAASPLQQPETVISNKVDVPGSTPSRKEAKRSSSSASLSKNQDAMGNSVPGPILPPGSHSPHLDEPVFDTDALPQQAGLIPDFPFEAGDELPLHSGPAVDRDAMGLVPDPSEFMLLQDTLELTPDESMQFSPQLDLFSPILPQEDDDVEDIIRDLDPAASHWTSEMSPSFDIPHLGMLLPPQISAGSDEILIARFSKHTCGILSVKDGGSENPWRTSIWPLAQQSPALYHALFAMAAFHSSKDHPTLRVYGMEHMRKSILCMVQGMEQMRTDAALATTLSLAFAESWDQHTSTGIQHLKGAKALMRQTLADRLSRRFSGEDVARLRFLYNTWLYMDVIARLTSVDEGDNMDIDSSPFAVASDAIQEVDPLMGCASTLFPLIGRAANLIQRIRKTESNSFSVISEAIDLKTLIEQWEPPQYFEPPEDPSSDVQHSFQTAQAYRWATLLYLHQAVPEIPSEPAAQLAKRVLVLLATVPLSSRTTVVHIYPLLAASCEAVKADDRNWILQRWAAMQNRLKIGNIDRCVDVIREVWSRRDSFEEEKLKLQRRNVGRRGSVVAPVDTMKRRSSYGAQATDSQGSSSFYGLTEPWKRKATSPDSNSFSMSLNEGRLGSIFSGDESIEYEKTVRGKLHWVGVMKDWGWEVLLG